MKGSLIIVGFFVLGALCGLMELIPFDIAKQISVSMLYVY